LAEYLDLADYLLIAEAVVGVPAEQIARWPGIGLAESALHAPAAGFGGAELYPDVIDKAAVLCCRLARNHPLPDGNKRTAFLLMARFLDVYGRRWGSQDVEVDAGMVERIAAGEATHEEVVAWIRERSARA
jgi:death-on-curing protein